MSWVRCSEPSPTRLDRQAFAHWPHRLAAAAEGRDDLRAEVAGTLAGNWFAQPEGQLGHELIAAGLLILSGVVDRDQLEQAVRVGYERGKGSLQGYDPSG